MVNLIQEDPAIRMYDVTTHHDAEAIQRRPDVYHVRLFTVL